MSEEVEGIPEETTPDPKGTESAQPGGSVLGSIAAGAIAGAGAGVASHLFTGGKMTFAIWLVAYILVISGAKQKWLATIVFVPVAIVVTALMQNLGLSE